jgi:hypothetical protein
LLELERRSQQRLRLGFVGPQAERTHALAVVGGEPRLVVERIEVRHAAGQEDHQEVLGPRLVVGTARGERMAVEELRRAGERRGQGERASGTGTKEIAATKGWVHVTSPGSGTR